jgi:endogenous inhibitor of DNA gyrase (YacG/DUF329 family)
MSESSASPAEFAPRKVRCPACSGQSLYTPLNLYRPFCSARCKGVDLGAWASEEFKLPDNTPPDEVFGDPRAQ